MPIMAPSGMPTTAHSYIPHDEASLEPSSSPSL